jgi:L-fucose isomerase-like protein
MSSSDEQSSDETVNTETVFHSMQKSLLAMIDEVDDSLHDLHHVVHELHQPQDLFEALGLQVALEKLLQTWVEEERLSEDGQFIKLTPEEYEQFKIPFDSNPISIYTICTHLVFLLSK